MFSKDDLLFIVPDALSMPPITGGFAQKVMILVTEAEWTSSQTFLEKMLGAAKLNLLQDALIIPIDGQERVKIIETIKNKQPEHVLVFGIPPNQLCLHVVCQLYEPFHFQGTTFLFTDALTVLEPNKLLKAKLWTAMQVIFKL